MMPIYEGGLSGGMVGVEGVPRAPPGHCVHKTQSVLRKGRVASFGSPWTVSTTDWTGRNSPRPSLLGTWTSEHLTHLVPARNTPNARGAHLQGLKAAWA